MINIRYFYRLLYCIKKVLTKAFDPEVEVDLSLDIGPGSMSELHQILGGWDDEKTKEKNS